MSEEEREALASALVQIVALEKRVRVLESFLAVLLEMEHARQGWRSSEVRYFDQYVREAWHQGLVEGELNKKLPP